MNVQPTTMKAIEIHQFGNSDVFTMGHPTKPVPQNGQVCLRIKAASFNPVDYKMRKGWYPIDPNLILGCDCSGIVASIGPYTDGFAVGDAVMSLTGSFFRCSNGSYAEYVCVPVELVSKLPKNVSFEEAAAVPLAAMTAYRATLAPPAFKKDHVVFVAGIGGGVGIFAIQFLRLAQVKEIYTVARDEDSATFLTQKLNIPRDHILVYNGLSMEKMKAKLLEMNHGKLFDATLDLVGGKVKQLCLELTGYSGHFSTILPESDFKTFDVWSENSIPRGRNMSIHQVSIGAELGDNNHKTWTIYQRHLEIIRDLIEKGALKPIVTHIGSLSVQTVRKAHALLESGRVKGKLVMSC